jgi:hypothetical protein
MTSVETSIPFTGSPIVWFLRGTSLGALLMAAVNALSYFVRSEEWGSLVGMQSKYGSESLGFPFQVWESGNTYGGMFADYSMIGLNTVVAVGVGMLLGAWAGWNACLLNRLLARALQDQPEMTHRPVQFSLSGLLLVTTLSAIVASAASQMAIRPETLMVIYVLGPLGLIILAMMPRNINWQQRVVIITPATFCLIAIALAVGYKLQMEFDKVLMGIFLCWTPQSAFAAVALTVWVFAQEAYRPQR